MNKNDAELRFGNYLKSVRISKGLSMEEVSRETRVSMSVLKAIENENLEELPDPAFVKGFLRAYSAMIGVDSTLVLDNYLDRLEVDRKEFQAKARIKSSQGFWKNLFTVLLLFALIVLVSLFIFKRSGQPGKKAASGNAQEKPIATKPKSPPKPVAAPSVEKKKQVLGIKAVEQTWMKVIMDDKAPKEFTLKAGDSLELTASTRFNILIGNSAGIQLTFNGKPIKFHAKSGLPVTLQLPNSTH